MPRSPSNPPASDLLSLRTCQACFKKSSRGRTGDVGSGYSDSWYCESCWRSWDYSDNPAKCSRDGCPYLRCSTMRTAFCCWECGSGKHRSRAHDPWCERRRCAAEGGAAAQEGGAADPPSPPKGGIAPAADAAAPPAAAEDRVEAIVGGLERSRAALKRPLAYTVVRNDPKYPPYACVREAPDARAREVGRLPHGRTVTGFPSLGWLRLDTDGLDGQWVFIGRQLAAGCLQSTVRRRHADGLEVEWAGVPDAPATYSIDWEVGPAQEGAVASKDGSRSALSSGLQASIGGLQAGCAVRVRVVAVLVELEAGAGRGALRIFGPWLETATEDGGGAAAPSSAGPDEAAAAAPAAAPAGAAEDGAPSEAPAAASDEATGPAVGAATSRPPDLAAAQVGGAGAGSGAAAAAAAASAEAAQAPAGGAPEARPAQVVGGRHGDRVEEEEQLEESLQLQIARARKWSVRDLVKSLEAKSLALSAQSVWECRDCGRLLPRETRVCRPCEAGVAGGGLTARCA